MDANLLQGEGGLRAESNQNHLSKVQPLETDRSSRVFRTDNPWAYYHTYDIVVPDLLCFLRAYEAGK